MKPTVLQACTSSAASAGCFRAHLLFHVVAKRYERGSIVLTSNLTLSSWGQALAGDAVLTAAMPDRLMHHAAVVQVAATATGCATRERVA